MSKYVDFLEAIRGAEGTKAKTEVLVQMIKDEDIKEYVKLVYDPNVNYGITTKNLLLSEGDKELDISSMRIMFAHLINQGRNVNASDINGVQAYLNKLLPMEGDALLCVFERSLNAGVDKKTVSKCMDLYDGKECIAPQLANKFDIDKLPEMVLVETKYDGIRAVLHVKNGVGVMYTRTGKEIKTVPHLVEKAGELGEGEFFVDGELIDNAGFLSTVSIARSDVSGSSSMLDYYVFDVIVKGENKPLTERKASVIDVCRKGGEYFKPVEYTITQKNNCDVEYQMRRSKGLEGIIVKNPSSLYSFGKRNNDWQKMKAVESTEGIVKLVEEGKGKFKGKIGALVCDVGGVEVRVGSGLNDELRDKPTEFFVGRIVEIGYHEKTPYGSLRHPRFIKFRDTLTGLYE